jgi:hypothetical protein
MPPTQLLSECYCWSLICGESIAKRPETRGGVNATDLEWRGCIRRQVDTPSIIKWRIYGPKTEVCDSGREPAW